MDSLAKLVAANMKKTAGMTLVELLVVIALVSILFGLSTIGIFSTQQKVVTSSFITTLIADLKQQQIKAMIGDTEGRLTHDSYGIYFESNRYILFHGTTYIPGEATNFIVNNNSTLLFSNINLPDSRIIFNLSLIHI